MAITRIIGFQNFKDLIDPPVQMEELWKYGSLPVSTVGGRFTFVEIDGRVWMENVPYRVSNYKGGIFTIRTADVFGPPPDDGSSLIYTLGFRVRFDDSGLDEFPDEILKLSNPNYSSPITIFDSKTFNHHSVPVELYFEASINYTLRSCSRWIDGVPLEDLSLPSWIDGPDDHNLVYGQYQRTHSSSKANYAFNDLYFMVDTTHLDDGLPSTRLGPVYVDRLDVSEVTLPDQWVNTSAGTAKELLETNPPDTNMQGYPALISGPLNDPITIGFDAPPIQEGGILYAEVAAYAHRNHGEVVAMSSHAVQGDAESVPMVSSLEPEFNQTGSDAMWLVKLTAALDGSVLNEPALGNLKLKLAAVKPQPQNQ